MITINDWERIEKYFIEKGIYSYYASFPTFYSHFCKGIYKSYYINNKIVVQKYNNNPRIFIIDDFNELEIEQLKSKNPLFIRKFLIQEKTKMYEPEFIFNNREIVYDLDKSKFKCIRNSYNYVQKHYPQLQIKMLDSTMINDLKKFILQWKEKHSHYFRLTYKRDLFLLECIDKLFGTIIYDGEKIVGAEINYPHPVRKDMSINIFRKHDVSYNNLHDFLKIKGCITNIEKGFEWSNDCNATDNKLRIYKEKFLGEKGYMYSISQYEIYKKEKVEDITLNEFIKEEE